MARNAKMVESLRLLRGLGLPVGTILDVGVRHLTWPLIEVFPDKKHVLFEPITDYFPQIRKYYASIDYELVNAAVYDVDGTVSIHSERKTLGDEISHSYIVQNATDTSHVVDCIRLDTFLLTRDIFCPYLLKIDVEGPDIPVAILQGCQQTLTQTSVVVIEMTVDRFVERASLLDKAGFGIWDIVDLCYYGECLWQVDALFVSRRYLAEISSLRPMHQQPFCPQLWQAS